MSIATAPTLLDRVWNQRCWSARGLLLMHAVFTLAVVTFVTWSVLSPDPYALVRDSSWQWLERSSDVVLHVAAFSVLSLSVLTFSVALVNELPRPVVVSVLGYCLAMEILQAFVPGRMCDPRDAVANATGFLMAFLLVRRLPNGSRNRVASSARVESGMTI